MKFRRPKVTPKARTTRQRRDSNYQAPAAFSYHAQRAERTETTNRQLPTAAAQRSKAMSMRYWTRRSSVVIVVVVILIVGISVISLPGAPRVVFIDQAGNQTLGFRSLQTYQATVTKDVSASFLNRNKLTINTVSISHQLQQQFPELANVSISLPVVAGRPTVYLQANAPSFVYQAINGTYVLDSQGTALIARDSAPASLIAKLPVISDQTGSHVQLGQRVISANNASFILTVLANFKAKQVSVTALDLPAAAAQELDVHIAGQPYYIKFNMHDSSGAQQQTGTYLATVQNLTKQHITPGQYIDVRLAGRAYYL